MTPPTPPLPLGATPDTETLSYGPATLVSSYGHPQAEYAAIHKAAGLMDFAHRGVLQITGKDRHSFLNNFLTNATWSKETKQGMAPNTGVYAFLLNGKGRVIADMNVLETDDGGGVLLETDRHLLPLLKSTLEKYVFTEKVSFALPPLRVLALLGPASFTVLQEAGVVAPDPANLPPLSSRSFSINSIPGTFFRDDPTGTPSLFLLVTEDRVADIWSALTAPYESQTNKRTLRPVGWAMFNAARIEAGRPLYGIDFTEASLPAEIGPGGFDRAVSVTKGCYLGQEIVARMYARNQVAKQLVGLKMSLDALPVAGAEVSDAEGNQVGTVTSSTLSPLLGGAALALATLKKSATPLGTTVRIPAEGSVHEAKVVELPFLKTESTTNKPK